MAERHKFFRQVRDNPLSAAIKSWGNTFDQGRNLRNFHDYGSFDNTWLLADTNEPRHYMITPCRAVA